MEPFFALRCLLLSLCIMRVLASQRFDGIDLILVMGATGSGKSTFINLASGSELQTSHELKSCTSAVQFSNPFPLEGHTTVLIDTPGFDDSTKSDADHLIAIKDVLAEMVDTKAERCSLESSICIVFPTTKTGGTARKNFDMVCKMCGNSTYPNVALVTNMWGDVRQEVGEARERQLKTDDGFFATVIGQGATLLRHHNTTESAHAILRHMLRKQPVPLMIQKETVVLKLPLKDTEAGKVLYREIREEMEAHEEEKVGWEARHEQEKVDWEARREQEKAEWEKSRHEDKAKWEGEKAGWEARREQEKVEWEARREREKAESEERRKQDKADSEERIRRMEADLARLREPRDCLRVSILGIFTWEGEYSPHNTELALNIFIDC